MDFYCRNHILSPYNRLVSVEEVKILNEFQMKNKNIYAYLGGIRDLGLSEPCLDWHPSGFGGVGMIL